MTKEQAHFEGKDFKIPDELKTMTPIASNAGDDEAEFRKLKVGEYIKGLLVDKFKSKKYDSGVYKIKDKPDEVIKIIMGTTILDKKMRAVEISTVVGILRKEDIPSDKGNDIQDYDVFVENY